LYPNGGVESLARSYVLVLFHKSLKVRFADVRIWSDRVKHFLKQFALEQVDLKRVKYWKFKELSDESFIKEFPNVVIQQEEIFKILEEEVTKVVYDIGKHKPSKVR
jgi:DNA-directed RNA polymerase III subunit RPC5